MEYLHSYGNVALKLATGLIVFLIILRTTGRSSLSQMSPVDLISNFVMGGIIGGVIYNPKIGVMHLIAVLVIWQILAAGLNFLAKRSPKLKRFVVGGDVPLVIKGEYQMDEILRQGLDVSELSTRLRIKGCSLHEVAFARLESNGDLSVIRKEEGKSATIVIKSGEISAPCLKEVGKTEAWLKQQLKKQEIALKDVFVAELYKEKMENGRSNSGLFIIPMPREK